MTYEVRDVAPGLWIWRVEHPAWQEGLEWEPMVTSTVVESGGEVALIDPLAPPREAAEIWDRLDAKPPTMAVILKPDHVRDIDLFARRYEVQAFGPYLFWSGRRSRNRARGARAGARASGRARHGLRRPRPQRDAALAPGAACAGLRRRADGARRRAPRLGTGRGTRSGCSLRSASCSTFRSST